MDADSHTVPVDILVSYCRDDPKANSFAKSIEDQLVCDNLKLRHYPLPASRPPRTESHAQETAHIEFSYWLVIVTSALLECWSGLVSVHRFLKLVRMQRIPTDSISRILPLVLGDADLSRRFHGVLPALSSYRPLVTSTTSVTQTLMGKVVKCIQGVLKKGDQINLNENRVRTLIDAHLYILRWPTTALLAYDTVMLAFPCRNLHTT